MATEIKRSNWARFCRRFNTSNRYRRASVSLKQKGRGEIRLNDASAFMGITITKKGRFIDGIDLFTAQPDPDQLTHPAVSIKQPTRITVEEAGQGSSSVILIHGQDGTIARVDLSGQPDPDQHQTMVEKLAYSYYERRGRTGGQDVDDWLEAERKVQAIEEQMVY